MKTTKWLFLLLLLMASSHGLKSQHRLDVEIVNLRSNEGEILLELLDVNNQHILGKKGEISNYMCSITIPNLKEAKYAIRYFHDENGNSKLDTNWLGIPSEGFGFSNDAYGSFGPKEFKEWLFIVSTDTHVLLKIKN